MITMKSPPKINRKDQFDHPSGLSVALVNEVDPKDSVGFSVTTTVSAFPLDCAVSELGREDGSEGSSTYIGKVTSCR